MGIDTFVASFKGGARNSKFKVIISYPGLVGAPNVSDEIVVKAAQLPSSTMGKIDVPYKGRMIPIPGDRVFDPWTMTIVNDTTFSHRNAFERWHNLMNSLEGNLQGTSDYKNLFGTIDVIQLDRDDRVLKTYKLINAFPITVSQIELGYDQNDSVEEFTVDIAYSHYETPSVSA